MSFVSWHDFYYAPWQEPWALWVAPVAFLVWRSIAAPPGPGVRPEARRFVVGWSIAFAFETLLDPVATGPLTKAIDAPAAGRALGLVFVLLGDLRIWWLVFGVERRVGSLARALLPTAGIPVVAWLVTRALAPLPEQALWAVHEALFVATAFGVSRRTAGPFERDVLAYAGVYYALWVGADVLILAGIDAGWLLRCVPNQLYYGFTVPFVWWRFFAPSYSAQSTSTQASR